MTDEQTGLIGREFRHFKGGHYRIECFAKDSETLEEMVVYRALYRERGLWVRPAKMFFETIERDGKKMKRFELLEENTNEHTYCRSVRLNHKEQEKQESSTVF